MRSLKEILITGFILQFTFACTLSAPPHKMSSQQKSMRALSAENLGVNDEASGSQNEFEDYEENTSEDLNEFSSEDTTQYSSEETYEEPQEDSSGHVIESEPVTSKSLIFALLEKNRNLQIGFATLKSNGNLELNLYKAQPSNAVPTNINAHGEYVCPLINYNTILKFNFTGTWRAVSTSQYEINFDKSHIILDASNLSSNRFQHSILAYSTIDNYGSQSPTQVETSMADVSNNEANVQSFYTGIQESLIAVNNYSTQLNTNTNKIKKCALGYYLTLVNQIGNATNILSLNSTANSGSTSTSQTTPSNTNIPATATATTSTNASSSSTSSISTNASLPKVSYSAGAALLGDKLLIYQGDYRELGNVDQVAQKMSSFDVLVLSHVSTKNTSNGCVDGAYPYMKELLQKVRRLKKTPMKIFGYVSSTTDAPGTGCGSEVLSSYGNWNCSGGICSQFITWVNEWLAIEDKSNDIWLDGIMIDYTTPVIINSAVRDNLFSYVKSKGKNIMTNITYPTASNVTFTTNSSYFGNVAGDYILIEGYMYGAGQLRYADTVAALNAYYTARKSKAISLAALASEAWATGAGGGASCYTSNHTYAYKSYLPYFYNGNVFSYASSDLGITSKMITDCDHSKIK